MLGNKNKILRRKNMKEKELIESIEETDMDLFDKILWEMISKPFSEIVDLSKHYSGYILH